LDGDAEDHQMTTPTELNERLRHVWLKYLPATRSRLEIVERALDAMETGSLSKDLILEAIDAAHKLAGSLGTFGLHSSSAIATKIELAFESGRFAELRAAELRDCFLALKDEIERKWSS
jgi:HPt (histidine-containing phosphotransfer) domain-containing protein